jgi:AGZA family xanthine/uracil permease-like MFS transporter
MASRSAQPLFVLGDIDGFFGLAIDNLIQFLLILGLGAAVLGFPPELVLGEILPGAALSVVVGNVFYALQAQRLSRETGRTDVTALPYGINTPSLFAFVFLVMLPVRGAALEGGASAEEAARVAWQVGLAACFSSGLIELAGSSIGAWVRRVTPRAALLSTLAGIAISFIAIDFALRTFESPLVAMLPLGVILAAYFARARMPLGLPGGLLAVVFGTVAAWAQWAVDPAASPIDANAIGRGTDAVGLYLPVPVLGDLWSGLTHPLFARFFLPVVLPMGLFNVLGSLQNIESAEAAGDAFPTAPSMVMNGAGSVVAAAFGSCFPTTIYIGHPGWKGLGARTGYSLANAAFFVVLALFGLGGLVAAVVPLEAGIAIVLYIGLVITAQAFQATPRAHAPAVAVGLFPGIAAWGVLLVTQTLGAAGIVLEDPSIASRVLEAPIAFAQAGLRIEGLSALSQGFILTCMVWSAAAALLIDRRFRAAAAWMGAGAGLAFFGFIHAGRIGPSGSEVELGVGAGLPWAIGYALTALLFLLLRPGGAPDGAERRQDAP